MHFSARHRPHHAWPNALEPRLLRKPFQARRGAPLASAPPNAPHQVATRPGGPVCVSPLCNPPVHLLYICGNTRPQRNFVTYVTFFTKGVYTVV